jgi:hypothetical protein
LLFRFGGLALHEERLIVVYFFEVDLDHVGSDGLRGKWHLRGLAELALYSFLQHFLVPLFFLFSFLSFFSFVILFFQFFLLLLLKMADIAIELQG